jgi:hypothetical protein
VRTVIRGDSRPETSSFNDKGGGDFADAFRAAVASRKPYPIDANTI